MPGIKPELWCASAASLPLHYKSPLRGVCLAIDAVFTANTQIDVYLNKMTLKSERDNAMLSSKCYFDVSR